MSSWALSELVEAAARCGRPDAADDALKRLAEMARACGTDWVLGVEARARALVADPAYADELYRHAIECLGCTRLRTELARAHLLYGEWLRGEGRRVDARRHLREAHDMLAAIGMAAFAERARRELLATGETVRKRTVETLDELTPQEVQVARLAADGQMNPEIGAQLFLSPRTVEWHLSKVFGKLGIGSRKPSPDGDDSVVTGAVRGIDPSRVVTAVLFTDIVGSTEPAARLGDRRWRELLDRYDAIVAAEVERFRGRLIETTGDGALATFDGPARGDPLRERAARLGANARPSAAPRHPHRRGRAARQ